MYTVYSYGSSNQFTIQTNKTTYQGTNTLGTLLEKTAFVYDSTGKMTEVQFDTDANNTVDQTVSYVYDSGGFRVEQTFDDGTNPPSTTVYHVDPSNHTGYAQVIEEGIDGNSDRELDAGEVEKAYMLGLDILAQATASQVLHLLTDAHGSTRGVLDLSDGATTAGIIQKYGYTAFGKDLFDPSTVPLTAVRYVGEMIDPVTGLSFNRARWYDPSLGRFTQTDPWSGDKRDITSIRRITRVIHSQLSSWLRVVFTPTPSSG